MVGVGYFAAAFDDGGDALVGVQIGGIMDPESVMAREERSEAMKPDLQKLREYIEAVRTVEIPDTSAAAVTLAIFDFHAAVLIACQKAKAWCDQREAKP